MEKETQIDINIEKSAALALLDRGIAFRLPSPWYLRIFGKKTVRIMVKRLKLGTLLHLSALEEFSPLEPMQVGADREKVIADMGSTPKSLPYKIIVENRKAVTRQVAACLLNSKLKIMLFTGLVAKQVLWPLNADQLQELVMWLFVYGRAESFTTTTKFLRRMKVTSPRN